MGNGKKSITKQLALALKHYRNASRNLQDARHWAVQNDRKHLEDGLLNLLHDAARVTGDLATLISVLEARDARAADSR